MRRVWLLCRIRCAEGARRSRKDRGGGGEWGRERAQQAPSVRAEDRALGSVWPGPDYERRGRGERAG